MKSFLSSIFIVFLLIMIACKTNTKTTEKELPSTLISYKKVKARCTQCPHFSIDILTNQTAIYEGKANVPFLGKKVISLSKKQFETIKKQFEQSNYIAFEHLYLSNRRDGPRMILSYKGHEVNAQEKVCPKPLLLLIELIESIKPV